MIVGSALRSVDLTKGDLDLSAVVCIGFDGTGFLIISFCTTLFDLRSSAFVDWEFLVDIMYRDCTYRTVV